MLITTDDQRLDDMRWMPKTRRLLGRAGVTFPNSINPHPLCCPARAEILTGQYAQNNGVRSNVGQYGGYKRLDPRHTIATWLDDAGYQTAFVGKYLNGYEGKYVGDEPGWDIWNPTIEGVYSGYGFTTYENGTRRRYEDIHNADWVGLRTRRYIRSFNRHRSPFFIWASHFAPHGSCMPSQETRKSCWVPPVPARRHSRLFAKVKSPSLGDPSYAEADLSDKPVAIRTSTKPVGPRRVNRLFRHRIRSLQAVDDAVARTIRVLRRTGELRNTLVLFTSDNGYLLGEHNYLAKTVPYTQSLAVPLLVRGPGVPRGVRRPQTATTIDLAPTILARARATATRPIDGRNLWPMLRRRSAPGTTTALIQAGPTNTSQNAHGWYYRGVYTGRYTYARYADGFAELYDHRRDPYEMDSVAEDRAYAKVRAELARRTRVLGRCSGSTCRTRFGPLPTPRRPRS